MYQNLASMPLSHDELVGIDTSLTELETRLKDMVDLTIEQRRKAAKMGLKSEQFCRETVGILSQNPSIVPPGIGLDAAQADLDALDALRPRFRRLRRLAESAADTELELGSDVMVTALEGYSLLKRIGRNHGLEASRRQISARFNKSVRAADPAPAPAPAPAAT